MNLKYLFILSCSVAFSSAVFAQDIDNSDDFGNVYDKFSYEDGFSADANDFDVNVNYAQETNLRKIFSDQFRYKWYLQFGGGLQTIWGANDPKASFEKRLTISPFVAVGYRFNHKFGARLSLTGGTVHGFNDGRSGHYRYWKKKGDSAMQEFFDQNIKGQVDPNDKLNYTHVNQIDPYWIDKGYTYGGVAEGSNESDKYYSTYDGNSGSGVDNLLGFIWGGNQKNSSENLYMRSTRYIAADISGTMSLTGLFRDGGDDTFFDATLLAGPTIFHTFSNQGNLAWTGFAFHTGVEAQFRLSETFSAFTNFGVQWMPDGFNGQYGGNVFQPITRFDAGIVYKIPQNEYAYMEPPVLDGNDPYLTELRNKLLNEINGIKDYQSEIDMIRKRLAELIEVDPNKPDSFFLPDVVEFVIGKSNIRPQQENVVSSVASYLNANKDASVIVTGFADRGTGNSAINARLSEERSIAVADALYNKYGIDRGRIAIDWRGDELQPFEQNDKNRAVLFYIDYGE